VKKPTQHAAKRIRDPALRLPRFPFLGIPVPDIDKPQLRDLFIPFGQAGYWVRYAVTDDKVIIIKIWHGRENRDPQKRPGIGAKTPATSNGSGLQAGGPLSGWRNRNAPKSALVPLKAAQLPVSKKASKNNGQNWTVFAPARVCTLI
jgi:plasmid stabilization system protein ParE